jgi:hypothetical protein
LIWRTTFAVVQVTIARTPAGVEEVLLEHHRIDDLHSNS